MLRLSELYKKLFGFIIGIILSINIASATEITLKGTINDHEEISIVCKAKEGQILECKRKIINVSDQSACPGFLNRKSYSLSCAKKINEKFWGVVELLHQPIVVVDIIGWSSFLIFLLL